MSRYLCEVISYENIHENIVCKGLKMCVIKDSEKNIVVYLKLTLKTLYVSNLNF